MIIKKKFDKIENENLRKILYINLVLVLGLFIAILTVIIKKELNIKTEQIINRSLIPWTDWTDVLKLSAGKAGSKATGNYFPFTYIIMSALEFISCGNYLLLYFVTFALCIIICFAYGVISLKSKISIKKLLINVFLLIFLQFPMIFVFQRGNIEILILTICILFYALYKKEKYNLAAIVLSFAVCMKLYPALLAMLFVSKKKYKSFALCAGMSIGITLISWLIMQEELGGFTHYLSGFTKFVDLYGGNIFGLQYNHSILFGIYYVLFKLYGVSSLREIFNSNITSLYTIIISLISIPLILYTTFSKMKEWKKLTIFTLILVSFPQVSFDYTLILLIIPIIEFVKSDDTKKWENITYSILFGLLLIPMNINEEILRFITPNIGLILKPIIIISIIIIILFSEKSDIKLKENRNEDTCYRRKWLFRNQSGKKITQRR